MKYMKVDEKKSEYRSGYQGQTFMFCSKHCKERFEENPERNLVPERSFESERKVAIVGIDG